MREVLRDKNRLEHIVHGYYQVRKDMLWNVILNDLQPLKEQIQQYINEL